MTIPFFRLHIVNHPTYLEHIQKHNSKNYIRGKFIRNVFGPLHRSGIFIVDGHEWQFQRKAATRAFSKRNFETHITKSLHHWLDILIGLLSNLAKEEKEFDFQELMGRLMFCLFLQIGFHEDKLGLEVLSKDPECLKSIPDYIQAFDQAALCTLFSFSIDDYCELIFVGFDRRRRDPLWRISERLSGEHKITQRATDLFYGKLDGLIKRRLEARKNGSTADPDAGVDLLDLFMQSTNDAYKLGGMAFSFLAAGRKSHEQGTKPIN
jgi:hypothetical protein